MKDRPRLSVCKREGPSLRGTSVTWFEPQAMLPESKPHRYDGPQHGRLRPSHAEASGGRHKKLLLQAASRSMEPETSSD
eukprot:s5096_g6.t1